MKPRSIGPAPAGRFFVSMGLFVAVGLLAGCQSDSAPAPQSTPAAEVAGLPADGNSTGVSVEQETLAKLVQASRVYFATDRYDLSPEAQATIRTQAALLQALPTAAVTIEGHADERGTREYNLALADRRADAVRNYLTALGIPSERVEIVSYGKERPDCADASESCWAVNRRGVTVVNQ